MACFFNGGNAKRVMNGKLLYLIETREQAAQCAQERGETIEQYSYENAVGMVCRGKAKTCKGDQWSYVDDLSDEEKRLYLRQ